MFWPSTYPSSRKAWRNACHIGASSRMPMRGILDGCCARARLTLAASNRPAPPTRAVNSRRLMSDMAYFLSRSDHQQPTDCTVSLPHSGWQVLGPDLNCSESGRDDRLVGEGLDQFDLLVGKWSDDSAEQVEHTNRSSFAQQRHSEDCAK